MNWLDYLLILIFVLNLISGVQAGFIAGATELLSLMISLVVALVAYPIFAGIFQAMGFSVDMARFFGFGFVFVALQIGFAIITIPLTKRVKSKIRDTMAGGLNKWTGPIPHTLIFFISTSFILAAFVVFPIYTPLRSAVINSRFGLDLAKPAIRVLQPVSVEFKNDDKSSPV
jgi:uncharacterized membrane protein required for colicin V production